MALVRIGFVEIPNVLLAGDVTVRPPGIHEVEVLLSVASLRERPVEYAATASINIDDRGRPESGFFGFVDQVRVSEQVIRLTLISGLIEVGERPVAGVEFHAMQRLEAAWSLMRMAGIDEDRIQIEGFRKGPTESFRVAVPLQGLTVDPDLTIRIDNVLVTSSPQVQNWADSYTYQDLVNRYRAGPLWAYTDVAASTAFDAEVEAMRRIERGIEWLTLRMNYSYSFTPGGSPYVHHRDYQRAYFGVVGPIVVGGQITGRGWIRNPEDQIERLIVPFQEATAGQLPTFSASMPANIREAIGFWCQAKWADNGLDAVVLLVTAMEFYVAGTKSAKAFTRRDRRGIERRVHAELAAAEETALRDAFESAGAELANELRARLDHLVQRVLKDLNEPSFLMRLSEALRLDAVPVSDDEWVVLETMRVMRNRLVHGEDVPQPDPALLRYGLALVNRMLMHRIARLAPQDVTDVAAG